jgi:hypothetical protein
MIPPSISNSTGFVDQILQYLALLSLNSAQGSISSLLQSFGAKTEPDFHALLPVYDRMLAVALLLAGLFMAGGIIERLLGGTQGLGWALLPRTLAAVFFAFVGLDLVGYLSAFSALLANVWDLDFVKVMQGLQKAGFGYANLYPGASARTSDLLSLIVMGLLTSLTALLVYLELVVRGALILIVTAFLPLVAVMAIWPRFTAAATHLAEFLVGLLLSKFVIATAVYLGFQLVLAALGAGGVQKDSMMTALAVLLIAGFSPVVLMQGLRFSHPTAGSLARGWAAGAASLVPLGAIIGGARRLASGPVAARLRQGAAGRLSAGVSRLRQR